MSVFLLKIIAVICMVCDHIRYVLPNIDTEVTRLLGRIAFPIFSFLIVEGYVHTKNLKKYMIRLGIFALLSEIPFILFTVGCNIYEKIELNVIFTLFFGIIALVFFDKAKSIFLSLKQKNNSENNLIKKVFCLVVYLVSIGIIAMVAQVLDMDYGALGISIILAFYILREKNILKNVLVASVFIIELFLRCKMNINSINYCIPYFAGYICSAAILTQYNGKIGKYKMKYFFYLFYPIHMILLYFLYNIVN